MFYHAPRTTIEMHLASKPQCCLSIDTLCCSANATETYLCTCFQRNDHRCVTMKGSIVNRSQSSRPLLSPDEEVLVE